MKKQTVFSTTGQRADIGNITIYRMLANRYADKVGPFVFVALEIAQAYRDFYAGKYWIITNQKLKV